MQVNNDIFGSVAHNDDETSLLLLDAIAYQRGYARVDRLSWHLDGARPPPADFCEELEIPSQEPSTSPPGNKFVAEWKKVGAVSFLGLKLLWRPWRSWRTRRRKLLDWDV